MEKKKTSLLIIGICAIVLSIIGVTYAFWELRLSQEEKLKPQVDLELALCENNIIAKGKATAFGDRNIQTYEFKLDDAEVWETSNSLTKSYSVEPGSHKVSIRVTDSKGITCETSKTIEVNYEEPTTIELGEKTIPLVTEGNGLYKVGHCDVSGTTDDIGFSQEEYRYAGSNYTDHDIYFFEADGYVLFDSLEECMNSISYGNCEVFMHKNSDTGNYVHNYVKFNEELWRIIGLVNVKTGDGRMTQRLKIVRDQSIGNYSWDDNSNDWTQATLMQMLNGAYYSNNGFVGNLNEASGLSATARKMIDTDITWNIGGWSNSYVTTLAMYEYERGTNTGNENAYPAEWNSKNTVKKTFNSVGLISPSDYGYATSGGTRNGEITRSECIKNTVLHQYDSGCSEKDWLLAKNWEWFLSPFSSYSDHAFAWDESGFVNDFSAVYDSGGVRPAVYLSSSVKITGGTGEFESPYELAY